jgi:SAM-dependent methyltransferase
MDGAPNPKTQKWKGNLYSETRYAVIKWLERELPSVTGDVLNIAAGNWPVPRQCLTNPGLKSYETLDKKIYGQSVNRVKHYGDVHAMPAEWTDKWDCLICNQAIECFENPFKAMDEMYRVLKPGGKLYIDSPFNYRWFGVGSWKDPNQGAADYWRITKDGWKLLTKKFKNTKIEGFGGTGHHDRFVYCVTAIK